MNGLGINGILYTFEVVPRKAIPLIEPLSRRNVTPFDDNNKTDEEGTEPENRFCQVFVCWEFMSTFVC